MKASLVLLPVLVLASFVTAKADITSSFPIGGNRGSTFDLEVLCECLGAAGKWRPRHSRDRSGSQHAGAGPACEFSCGDQRQNQPTGRGRLLLIGGFRRRGVGFRGEGNAARSRRIRA